MLGDIEHWPTMGFLKLLVPLAGFFIAAYYLYRLQSRRNEKRVRILHAEKIDHPDDIKTMLGTVMQQKVRLIIRFNNRKRSFASSLLSITPDKLFIDSLFPEEGNELIEYSHFITVEFLIKKPDYDRLNLPYTFRSSFIRPDYFKDYPALLISFPEYIVRNQKRNYLRINPPVKEPLHIQFIIDEKTFKEKIINISGGGVSFYTNLVRSVLWPGRIIDAITIILPDAFVITCSLIIHKNSRNEKPVFIEGKPIYYYCGAEFTGINRETREKIVRYVVERERTELKRLSREFD